MGTLKATHLEGLERRYWVFICDNFYPSGGMKDYQGSVDKLKHVKRVINEYPNFSSSRQSVHVLDTETNNILTIF